MCPEHLWDNGTQFWYHAFHTLFFLDYYLTPDVSQYEIPAPFELSEFEDRMPSRTYTQTELLAYLDHCRAKSRNLIGSLTDETSKNDWQNLSKTMRYNFVEIILYNMRHVQHHTGQLNLLLRQGMGDAPQWVRDSDALF